MVRRGARTPALGSPAAAKDGDVLVTRHLHRREAAKLKLSAENGRIEVEFEVDQNRNGVPWTVVLRRTSPRRAADPRDPGAERVVRGAQGDREPGAARTSCGATARRGGRAPRGRPGGSERGSYGAKNGGGS